MSWLCACWGRREETTDDQAMVEAEGWRRGGFSQNDLPWRIQGWRLLDEEGRVSGCLCPPATLMGTWREGHTGGWVDWAFSLE